MRKLNVHLTLDQQAKDFCRDLNRTIRRITPSVIDFEPNSSMIPHLSLAMGHLNEQRTVGEILEAVARACLRRPAIRFHTSAPYLESVCNSYVLIDVTATVQYAALKTSLHEALDARYLHIQAEHSNVPHITLANITDKHDEVRECLRAVDHSIEVLCDSVEVSDVGPKGTCINSLARFALTAR